MFDRLIFAVLVLSVVSPAEASKVKGVVLLNEVSGQPVENVAVSAAGANPEVTDSLGMFTLEFPSKRPGETIRLIIAKKGFEVVNDVQLEMALPIDPDAKQVIILLCKAGDREEMARRFYRLKSVEAIEESYRRKAEKAGTEGLGELRRERDQAVAAAKQAAEELAKTKPGEASELYRTAMRLFLDGEIDEALKVLDEEKLRSLLTSAKDRKAEAERAIAEATEAWLLKAQLLTTQFQFAEAEKAYRAAIEAAPDSFGACVASARFSQKLNRYQEAREGYERCLELARRCGKDADVAGTLNNLGIVDSDQSRMEEARKEFDEALKIRRELAEKNPETYLPDLALTLNNLGNLDADQNRMDEAQKEYEEALRIDRELAQKNPETYLMDVAGTLNNLAILHREENLSEEALREYEEALKIDRELAQRNPETYLPDLAETLNNLGNLRRGQDQMIEADKQYKEALRIYRELAKKNPETYLPYVAGILNNLGILLRGQNQMDEARKQYQEALKIYRELAKKNPETFLPYVAKTLNNLGNLDFDQNQVEEARKEYEEALKILQRFAERDPKQFKPLSDKVLHNLKELPN